MSLNIHIIYQDNDIVAINKPAGMSAHKGVSEKGETVVDWLVEKFPEMKKVGDDPELRPGIVHRLDKETSGVLIMAKNQKAFDFMKSRFQNREVIKKYLALVEGKLKIGKGVIALPIGKSVNDFRKKMASGVVRGELREAITEYETLEIFPEHTLVEVYPKTGRTHQVRVHFKAIGNPIVCDSLYGGKRMTCPFGLERHFLHANFLEFTAPSGAKLKIEADLPEDLEKVLKGLREK